MHSRALGPKVNTSLGLPNKPSLPLSTPAPGPGGRSNTYASVSSEKNCSSPSIRASQRSKASSSVEGGYLTLNEDSLELKKCKRTHGQRTKRISMESNQSRSSVLSKTSTMTMALTEIIRGLPYEERERVSSIVNMAVYSSGCFQRECHAINVELLALKASYKVKCSELKNIHKECDAYREQLTALEEKLTLLEDDSESRQNYALRNFKAISRLSSTNKTLIDAFAMVREDKPKRGKNVRPDNNVNNKSASLESGGKSGIRLSPIRKGTNAKDRHLYTNTIDPYEGTPVTSNEKLRERLLRVAKEHSRVEKNVEGLESKINGLRSNLRIAERRNRQLQLELDELKEQLSNENKYTKFGQFKLMRDDSFKQRHGAGGSFRTRHKRVPMTNRLNALVSRNAFDSIEGVKHMDAMISHISRTPSTMIESDIGKHLCSRHMCRVFDSEEIALFLLQPGGSTMHRYITGSDVVSVFEVGKQDSFAEHALRSGAMRRYNNNVRQHSMFNPAVDSIPSLAVKRILTFPLRNQQKNLVVGCMHLLNKRSHSKFTEVDELYGSAFSDLVGVFLSSSVLFRRLWIESDILCSIIRAPGQLLESLAPNTSIAAGRPLLPEEVLYTIEHVVRDALKCSNTKAFLLSTKCGYKESFFITLSTSSMNLATLKPEHLECHHVPIHSGIAGHVAVTKTPYLAADPSSDNLYNTQIDIAFESEKFYCVPILSVSQEVVAVVELVPSALSPKFKSSKEMGDSTLAFENAADWLSHTLQGGVEFMVGGIDSPVPRPDLSHLEPITMTEKFVTVRMMLEAVPPVAVEEDYESLSSVSRPGSPLETSRQRTLTIDEETCDNDDSYNNHEEEEEGGGVLTDVAFIAGNNSEKYERQIAALRNEIEAIQSAKLEECRANAAEEEAVRQKLDQEFAEKLAADIQEMAAESNESGEVERVEELDREIDQLSKLVQEKESEKHRDEMKLQEDIKAREEETGAALRELAESANVSAQEVAEELVVQETKEFAETNEVEEFKEEVVPPVKDEEQVEVNEEAKGSGSSEPVDDLGNQDFQREAVTDSNETQVNEDIIKEAKIDTAEEKPIAPVPAVEESREEAPKVVTSARSSRSHCSEHPPTPSKEVVESSPRHGNWVECYDQDGNKYYYNSITEESSWHLPSEDAAPYADNTPYYEDVPRIGDWMQMTTEEGHVYWVHEITGESTWDTPTADEASLVSPQLHNQSAASLSQYVNNANDYSRVSAGDYSIEL